MKVVRVWAVIALAPIAQALAADPPPIRTYPPKVHHSICSLAESLADKFPSKKLTSEEAQHTCQQLAPTLNAENLAEFMRCCRARLLGR